MPQLERMLSTCWKSQDVASCSLPEVLHICCRVLQLQYMPLLLPMLCARHVLPRVNALHRVRGLPCPSLLRGLTTATIWFKRVITMEVVLLQRSYRKECEYSEYCYPSISKLRKSCV